MSLKRFFAMLLAVYMSINFFFSSSAVALASPLSNESSISQEIVTPTTAKDCSSDPKDVAKMLLSGINDGKITPERVAEIVSRVIGKDVASDNIVDLLTRISAGEEGKEDGTITCLLCLSCAAGCFSICVASAGIACFECITLLGPSCAGYCAACFSPSPI